MNQINIRTGIALLVTALGLQACSNINRHKYELEFETSARLTLVCHNCFYYTDDYSSPPDTLVIDREIDAKAIELFESIEFCGLGFTTPDGWLEIKTDTGFTVSMGILFPDQEYNPTLRMQSYETGLGEGCRRKDQRRFEKFFRTYADKLN